MNHLVKILIDDDGEEKDNPKWCLTDPANHQGNATLCTAEFFGDGEGDAVYKEKLLSIGGITCEKCLEKLNTYKKVNL